MGLISEIEIRHFRSISRADIKQIGDFTAFVGPNNAGKSNVLRALNAFFSGLTDPPRALDLDADYHKPDLRHREARRIRISVTFQLPTTFKFRKRLEAVESLLAGRSFKISKEWTRNSPAPFYYLNDDGSALGIDDRGRVDAFLSLISFRYIPNRVLPLEIIRTEHQALRDSLVRRLGAKYSGQDQVFKAIRETSSALIANLAGRIQKASDHVGTVRLATPTSWRDMVFAFGYKLATGDFELDDELQGSGIQSLLMLETLALIDRDYFQKFGWRQAAIWALEEPESSLHSILEANVASLLRQLATGTNSRLQILITTHSDLMLQFADRSIFVDSADGASKIEVQSDRRAVLERSARAGISRWVHPILTEPLNPIVLVEGKYDQAFVEAAIRLIDPDSKIWVTYLEQLQGGPVKGGVDELLRYIKDNIQVIRARISSAPVIVVLDWDSSKRVPEFERQLIPDDPCRILAWSDTSFNPRLGTAFHGIERHISDRILSAAGKDTKGLGRKKDDTMTISKDDYPAFKEAAFKVVRSGMFHGDLAFARPFVQAIVDATRQSS